jgi:xanthine/uracil permease
MSALGKQVVVLIAVLIALDAGFVAIYFLGNVRSASDGAKVVFTAVWTVAVLIVAVRGLARIRIARLRRPVD